MEKRINIGLVEDQHLFRQGMKSILSEWPEFAVMFESENGYSVPEKLMQKESDPLPNIMLVDLSLPPDGRREFSGLDLIAALQEEFQEIKCIVLSAHHDPYLISRCIEQGAAGYLVKDCDPQEVHDAIVSVWESGSYINGNALKAIQGRLVGKVKPKKTDEELTEREIEVLELVCQQMTADEIGDKLFISPKTVNGHKNNLLQKTGSKNMTGLVMYAVKHGIVQVV